MVYKFSIVIPTKNEEKNIIKCLNSILIQKQKKIEVLVVDSFSKDQTIKLIKKLKIKNKRRDITIKIISKNLPAEKAIAFGIHNSKGEIISFLGADDRLYNNETLSKVYSKFKNINEKILYGSYVIINDNEKVVKRILSKEFKREHILNHENYVCATSLFFKKDIFNTIRKNIDDGYDFAFILKYSKKLNFYRVKDYLSKFKIHNMSNSGNFYKNIINIKKDYEISKKYGGKLFNTYHKRFLIIRILQFFKLLWLAELKRKISMSKLVGHKIDFKKKSQEVEERVLQKV